VTIKDVAATARVSVATVSRVLNGSDRVDPELAARVHEAVARLSYRRSGLARSLRAQRARVVGLIISDIRNPFFTDVVRGIEDRVGEDGYSLVLCNSDEKLEKEADYLDLFVEERMAGAIVSPASSRDTRLDKLTERGTPVVVIDREAAREAVDTVLVDNVRGGENRRPAPGRERLPTDRLHHRTAAHLDRGRTSGGLAAGGSRRRVADRRVTGPTGGLQRVGRFEAAPTSLPVPIGPTPSSSPTT